MYDTDLNHREILRLLFFLRIYRNVYRAGITNPCQSRWSHCGDDLTTSLNPKMTAAWVEPPCLN